MVAVFDPLRPARRYALEREAHAAAHIADRQEAGRRKTDQRPVSTDRRPEALGLPAPASFLKGYADDFRRDVTSTSPATQTHNYPRTNSSGPPESTKFQERFSSSRAGGDFH